MLQFSFYAISTVRNLNTICIDNNVAKNLLILPVTFSNAKECFFVGKNPVRRWKRGYRMEKVGRRPCRESGACQTWTTLCLCHLLSRIIVGHWRTFLYSSSYWTKQVFCVATVIYLKKTVNGQQLLQWGTEEVSPRSATPDDL